MSKALSTVVIILAIVMIVVLALVFYLLITDGLLVDETAEVTVTPSPAATVELTSEKPTSLPTAAIEVKPTNTQPPSPTPTETPIPTETPLPTETPVPPTNTPVPIIYPTNTPAPPPPPTNTPEPPAPPSTNGLVLNSFSLEGGPNYPPNQPIWFNFDIANISGAPVPFGALGVMPKKDGTDRQDWYQHSWGGNNDSIPPNGLVWRDNIKLSEGGSYTLRLVICFDGYGACTSGQGNWITLSQEVPITVG
jgi:hypothetical protein